MIVEVHSLFFHEIGKKLPEHGIVGGFKEVQTPHVTQVFGKLLYKHTELVI